VFDLVRNEMQGRSTALDVSIRLGIRHNDRERVTSSLLRSAWRRRRLFLLIDKIIRTRTDMIASGVKLREREGKLKRSARLIDFIPRATATIVRPAIVAGLLLTGIAGAAQSQPAAAPTTVPVGTVSAALQPTVPALEFVGRVEAINRVDIKARVTGFLEEILFTEGDLIKAGAPIYRIEPGLFEAAVKQAQGALERAKSAKVLTEIQLQRASELLEKASGTAVARDQAKAADQQAEGAILEAEANLQTAKINLGYTEINAPIAGKIGRTNITKGNVVGPDKGTLTSIVSQDPMYVTFPVSQREFLRAQQTGQGPDKQSLKVRLRYSDGTFYDHLGVINFVDVSVNRATDSVVVRATVPNPNEGIIDGQLMSVVVESAKHEEKVVIPQAALIADQQGVYVFVVDDGKAAIRRVKTGGSSGPGVIVESGLSPGTQVIVEGLQSIRPGTPVRASPLPPTPGQG
jgi:membrane fusion protein (multidrug efflux system)